MRKDGSVDFYRGWKEYQNGFGSIKGEFWLGLEKISRLTLARNYKLRVSMKSSNSWKYAEYETFIVFGEEINYKLSIGKYTGKRHHMLLTVQSKL